MLILTFTCKDCDFSLDDLNCTNPLYDYFDTIAQCLIYPSA